MELTENSIFLELNVLRKNLSLSEIFFCLSSVRPFISKLFTYLTFSLKPLEQVQPSLHNAFLDEVILYCSNEGPEPSSSGNNSKVIKIHRIFKEKILKNHWINFDL